MFHVPEQFRVKKGALASDKSLGNNGAFVIPHRRIAGHVYVAIASDGSAIEMGTRWEHVSIHIDASYREVTRCPTWQEMCDMKDLFWDAEDTVIQYHPPRSEYVDCHPTTLHLWRPLGVPIPLPPSIMV